jgi:hypothetical protein
MNMHGGVQELVIALLKANQEKKDEVKEDGINN